MIVLRAGLHRLGYALAPGGTYDEATRLTVEAFQRHWRPGRVDGIGVLIRFGDERPKQQGCQYD